MEYTDRELLVEEPFYKLEYLPTPSLLFITYRGQFDLERYKVANITIIDLLAKGKARAIISDHRAIEVLPRDAQKWFTGEMTQMIKTKLGKDLDKIVFVALTLKRDPIRNAVAGFLAYMVNLFINARFHYANTMEDAFAYCEVNSEKNKVE